MGAIKIKGATSGSTTITAPDTGGDETIELSSALAGKLESATAASTYLPIAGGKILQVVRATDSTDRSTTSTSFVDASVSVTITPQKSDSAVLLVWSFLALPGTNALLQSQITDDSDNSISGAELSAAGAGGTTSNFAAQATRIAYDTPATASAVTYKGRFRSNAGTSVTISNSQNTGQLFAIEVSA
jgi:hypothetical protein